MRNVFDQYRQPENRLTHALACTLQEDRSLIRPFLRWLGAESVPPLSSVQIIEKQVPGERQTGEESERRGLPDLVFFTEEGRCMAVECKVQAKVAAESPRLTRR